MRRLLIPLAALALLAGCGSDDDDGGSDGPTRAEYIAEADAICKTANDQARALNERLQAAFEGATDDAARLAAITPILKEGLPIQKAAFEKFKAVKPPEADQAKVAELVQQVEGQNAQLEKVAKAAEAGDGEAFTAASTQLNETAEAGKQESRAFGFKECGSGRNEAGAT